MVLKTLAAMGLIIAVSAAPAFAWGAKRGDGTTGAGVSRSKHWHGRDHGSPVTSASEPLTALAVGLGLLGARLLRRS
jgi:hypothetical protein